MKEIYNIKGLYNVKSIFIESFDNNIKISRGLLMPKGVISRNGVLYEWPSVVKHHKELIGLPVLYNHISGTEKIPLGHFTDSIILESLPAQDSKWYKPFVESGKVKGWYYENDLNQESEYYNSIIRGDISAMSVQLFADQAIEKEDMSNGLQYTLAIVGNILEASAVDIPGFSQTNIELAFSEAFKGEEQMDTTNVQTTTPKILSAKEKLDNFFKQALDEMTEEEAEKCLETLHGI